MFQSMSYTLDTPRHSRRIMMLLLLLRLVPHDFWTAVTLRKYGSEASPCTSTSKDNHD